ncbi:hypothetical protein HYZ97_00425 [Candidatus Pacearchaeota archaeon]|nr:hypothetical protein [Candidatus Pacearchaeota archaeon]
MLHRRVLRSYGLLFLVIIFLIALGAFLPLSLAGLVIDQDFSSARSSESFSLSIEEYTLGRTLRVEYLLQETAGASHELEIIYEVYDGQGIQYALGIESVVLGADNQELYLLSIPLSSEIPSGAVLLLEAREGEERSVALRALNNHVALTGNAIKTEPMRVAGSFAFFLIVLGVLFYYIRLVYRRRMQHEHIRSLHEKNLVALRL